MSEPRLSLNHFLCPVPARTCPEWWIDHLEDVLIELDRDDVGDVIAEHSAYPLDDYLPARDKSSALTWLNEQVKALRRDHQHVEVLHPRGLTLNGQPAALIAASDDGIDTASQKATAFAMLAWLANEHHSKDQCWKAA